MSNKLVCLIILNISILLVASACSDHATTAVNEKWDYDVVALPFIDSLGNVYLVGPDNQIEFIESIHAEEDQLELSLPDEVNQSQLNDVINLLSADFHALGIIGVVEGNVMLMMYVVDGITGNVIGSTELALELNQEDIEKLPLPEGFPDHALSLTISSLIQVNSIGGLKLHNLTYKEDTRAGHFVKGIFRILDGFRDPIAEPPYKIFSAFDDEEGDDPRDTPPPNLYGEEIDSQTCRVKLQCRWGMSTQYYTAIAPGFLYGAKHCGYFTYIPSATPERLGTHVQPGTGGSPASGSFLNGHVQGLIFISDRGFQEYSWAYKFVPYDVQGKDACDIATCVRRISWDYSLRDARPYNALAWRKPNSNSFIGVVRDHCDITGLPVAGDGQYKGLTYWRFPGVPPGSEPIPGLITRHWRTHDK